VQDDTTTRVVDVLDQSSLVPESVVHVYQHRAGLGYRRSMSRPDIAVRNVRIFDGQGGEAADGDIEITSDRITAVGTAAAADLEIDGRGQVLCPGFIDVHTHDDAALLAHPGMHFKLAQGCSSVVVGNCGFSAVPPTGDMLFRGQDKTWTQLDGYMAAVDARSPAVNFMSQVGHNTVRQAVMGIENREPTTSELAVMKSHVDAAMERGACGFTTGLIYEPGRYSLTEEVVELAKVSAGYGGVYNSHIRNEGDRLLESVAELLEIGSEAGCGCHISHHKSAGPQNWGKIGESLALVDEANAGGADITLDVYPYTAGSGPMHQYYDVENIDPVLAAATQIASCSDFPELQGRRLVDIVAESGEPIEDLVRRIITAPGKEHTICIQFVIDEADIETNLAHPLMMIGSDGIPDLSGVPHPRLYGTFPRVLGRYVREKGVIELAEAIRRMTSLSADRFGLLDRGRVVVGGFADLVMFDPDVVADTATYEDPQREPIGVSLVVVNGKVALRGGTHTGVGSGRALRFGRD